MKRVTIPVKIRDLVAQRALYRCEYCQIHEDDHFLAFHIDHILALKHGGTDNIENLAWACPTCNTYKGTDFATFLNLSSEIIPLFNPRVHIWTKHFTTENGEIFPLTRIGEATIKILKMNDPDVLIFRQILVQIGRYA